MRRIPIVTLGLLTAISEIAAAAPRKNVDVCVVNRVSPGANPLNTLVFRDVAPLSPGGAISLRGLYFSSSNRVSPFAGSAVMESNGTVRLGLFVHSSANPGPNVFLNDFTLSGLTDTSFAGALNFDNDGDFLPNGTITFESEDCAAITIP
jgi:hypothetical protein